MDTNAIHVNTKLSVLKPIDAQWLIGLNDHLQNKTKVVKRGFELVGIQHATHVVDLDPEDLFKDLN